jgi:hypothetical protein
MHRLFTKAFYLIINTFLLNNTEYSQKKPFNKTINQSQIINN